MQKRYLKYAAGVSAAVSAAFILVNCSGGSVDDQHDPNFISQAQATLAVPGISSAVVFSFDLGAVDPATHLYYVTDRTNKAITVVNLNTNAVFQFKPNGVTFAGCGSTTFNPVTDPLTVTPMPGCTNVVSPKGTQVVNNDTSGPDGLDIVGTTLYVGDVNQLVVLDKGTGALAGTAAQAKKVIASVPGGLRADEGCWDPVNNIYGISTPGAAHPFMTFYRTTTPSAPVLLGTVIMDQPAGTASGGLEACVWDTGPGGTGMVFVNNDGNNDPAASATAARGEMDGMTAASILALGGATVQFTALAGTVKYPLPDVVGVAGECDPTGIALGPGNHIGAMCRTGTIGRSLNFLILDKTNGTVVATVVGAGGGDQITYDPTSNKWYLADSRSTAARTSCGGGTAVTCPLTPKVGVVSGSAPYNIVAMITSGNNSHSIAVDSALRKVISPFTNPSASGGGQAYPNGGINIFATQ